MTETIGYGGPSYLHYDMRVYEPVMEDDTGLVDRKAGAITLEGNGGDVFSIESDSKDSAIAHFSTRTTCFSFD